MLGLDGQKSSERKRGKVIAGLGVAEQLRRHGPQVIDHGVSFNLWAPSADFVELLEVGRPPRRMPHDNDGWYQTLSPTAHVGTRYQFRMNGNLVVPDPASCFQPEDVGKPSEVINTAALRDATLYPGRSWAEAVIYELHVGPSRRKAIMSAREIRGSGGCGEGRGVRGCRSVSGSCARQIAIQC
ncbi:hypothetical protein [Bradyrhizobium monzae]|uniref:hypothetical protein n=1 Tax=Bradyrhizobium sp. Oc8 TaxID=2876780 RepID=UPI001F2E8F9D|nr:hypothetical protein [Bradyrhizobium sp. Oc8]